MTKPVAEKLISQYLGACPSCGAEPGFNIDCRECMDVTDEQDLSGYPGADDSIVNKGAVAKAIDDLANGVKVKNDKIDVPVLDPGASNAPGEYQLRSLITTMSGAKPI